MTTSLRTGLLIELPLFEMHEFQHQIKELLGNGFRLVGFFGSPSEHTDDVYLNAVFSDDAANTLKLIRTLRAHHGSYPSLTTEYPAFHCFERECYEQYKIRPIDHPWLKPIRNFPYPFYKLEGKEVHEVGVGPIHAGVIEPGHFRFMCYGEKVQHLEIQLGFQHRGVESLLLTKNPACLAPLIETVAGDSSIAHTWAYCQAWEALCKINISPQLKLVRGIALELERIAMHLSGLAGMSTDIAFLPGGSTYGRLRTAAINTSMWLCGSRFGRGWIRPGEVRCTFEPKVWEQAKKTLQQLQLDLVGINDLFKTSKTVQHRLIGTGTILKETALEMGFVGLAAEAGDCWTRAMVRIREIDESLEWLFSAIDDVQRREEPVEPVKCNQAEANCFAISTVKAWRGEVMHYLETNSEGKLVHYKVQDPSIRNWFALALAVRGEDISDFPICNKSFDLSYCGQDL